MLSAQNLTIILNTALQKLWQTPALKNHFTKHNASKTDSLASVMGC
jgi:hypothetical protein